MDRPVAARAKTAKDAARPAAPRDEPVRRTQGPADDPLAPLPPGIMAPINSNNAAAASNASQPIALEAALYGAITSNPDLVALRGGTQASAEAVEVARRFPTTLNPTLWVDVRPLVYERSPGMNTPTAGGWRRRSTRKTP